MRIQTQWQRWATLGAAAVLAVGVARVAAAQPACVGDCAGDGEVTVEEIITMVNIANGSQVLEVCPNADGNGDGQVAIDDIIQAVNNANNGCPPPTTQQCGNRKIEPPEECDNGGICIGGNKAGTACESEAECGTDQPGVCEGGFKIGTACRTNENCPGSTCVRCKTFGGDGCAANCTDETAVTFTLVPGVIEGLNVKPGTSGAKVYGDVISELPLPLNGTQTLIIGKERDGKITGVINAASVSLPKIPVSTIACACVRGLQVKTCGGTLFTEDGALAANCSEGIPQPETCPEDRPCAFVNGPGNSAAGTIGCNGLEPVNAAMTQDCNPEEGGTAFPPQIVLSGTGPAGSALLLNTLQIGTQTGACTANFCTPADPVTSRGNPTTFPFTSGVASGQALNISNIEGENLGPYEAMGAPLNCANLTQTPPVVTGATLSGSYTSCDSATIGDVVITNVQVAQ